MAIDQPILLVGSIPGDDAEAVFRACGPALGEHVRAIPDGETGLRRVWVNFIAATVLNTHPSIRSVSQPKPVGSIANEWRTASRRSSPPKAGKKSATPLETGKYLPPAPDNLTGIL